MLGMIYRFCLIFLVFLASCSSKPEQGKYSIGRDPSWFPLNLGEQTANVNAFTNALVGAMAKVEQVPMHLVEADWDNLFLYLDEKQYAGVLSVLPPRIENRDKFDFSNPFILLGPVLVVPEKSQVTSLNDLDGKIVGVNQFDESVLIVQKQASIVIRLYDNIPAALEELAAGKLDGLLVPTLEAEALVPHAYSGVLKIASSPLSSKGLRLVTLKGEHEKLIEHFNSGLKRLKKSGRYAHLREKFGVY